MNSEHYVLVLIHFEPHAMSAEKAVDTWLDMWILSIFISRSILKYALLLKVGALNFPHFKKNSSSVNQVPLYNSRYDNKPVSEWLETTRNMSLPSVQRNFEGIIGYFLLLKV